MQSEKVLVMPTGNPDRPFRLRSEESPPFPEHDIETLRAMLEIKKTVRETAFAVDGLESELRNQGEKLEQVAEMAKAVKALETTFQRHGQNLERVRRILWFVAVAGGTAMAAAAFELYKHFYGLKW